jgi:hypothetical protein
MSITAILPHPPTAHAHTDACYRDEVMAADPKEQEALAHATETTEETGESRELYLSEGRTLRVSREAGDELVEIRSSSGMVEVRIKLTEAGPVLAMEAVKLQLKATESVEVEARSFHVTTEESIKLETKGELEVVSDEEMRLRGKKIWLN